MNVFNFFKNNVFFPLTQNDLATNLTILYVVGWVYVFLFTVTKLAVTYSIKKSPWYAQVIGFTIALASSLLYPIGFFFQFIQSYYFGTKIKESNNE